MFPTPERPLGEEHFFHQLITDHINDHVRKSLKRFNIHSVLDIGCSDGTTLILLYYLLGCDKLRGIDVGSPEDVLTFFNEQNGTGFATLTDLWLAYKASPTDVGEQIPGKEWLDQHMYVSLGRELRTWRPLQGTVYDAIIMSQAVHFLTKNELLHALELIRRHLRPDGLCYISMKTEFTKDTTSDIDGVEQFEICSAFAQERGLKYFEIKEKAEDGKCHTWTNL